MTKSHDLKTAIVNNLSINYFYAREKNDRNGNPRYRVFILDPDGPAVYETIFKTYEGLIAGQVKKFLEDMQK